MTDHSTDTGDADATGGFENEYAATFAVLSRCFRMPTESLVEAVDDGALSAVAPGVREVALDDLRAEYSRLFIGPGDDQIPPYESVYRDRKEGQDLGPVNGASTDAVVKWYRSYGVAPGDRTSDLPDHIATELEFLAYLADNEDLDACEQFLDEHVRQWADEFLSAVVEETRHPFYEAVARTTRDVVQTELTAD